MIIGEVTLYGEARVPLVVVGIDGDEHPISAVIDTGFTGNLTLPAELIQSLGLTWMTRDQAILSNGAIDEFDVYVGELIWDGEKRRILIEEANIDPLVGMEQMRGYELVIPIVDGGLVRLSRIQG